MKQVSMFIIGAFLICVCANTNLLAQKQVKISGSTCKGSTLTANLNGAAAEKIEWRLNGKTIAAAGSTRQGVTVAGGNGAGDGANQLYYPNGLFVDKDDNIWVADASNGRVQKFAPGNPDAVTIGADLPNAPTFPVNVVVCPKTGAVYVADYFEGKVKRLAKNGTRWVNVAGQNDELDLVRGVWVDSSENVYCTQYGYFFNGTVKLNGMILKYPKNSSAWQIVAGGNGTGSALNQFSIPTSVMLDDEGNIYVADGTNDHGLSNSRVMKWAPGATEGIIVAGGNGEGYHKDQCPTPIHAFVDRNKNVYVSNSDPYNKVTKWAPGGTTGKTVAGGNGRGSNADQFYGPFGVFVKGKYLYVVDASNHRVQRFDLTESNSIAQFTVRHQGTYTAVATFEDGSVVESNSITISACNESADAVNTDALIIKENTIGKIIAYPNPTKNSVTINYNASKNGQYIFQVTDVSGRILLRKEIIATQGLNHTTIDVSRFAKGSYFINIIRPDKTKESIQVSKE